MYSKTRPGYEPGRVFIRNDWFLSRESIAHNGTQRFLQLAVILDL